MRRGVLYFSISIIIPLVLTFFYYKNFQDEYGTAIKKNMDYIVTPTSDSNDIVYMGNSRMWVHVDPLVIENNTGLKGYNIGLDGSGVVYFRMALYKYLECHPKPRIIVINADFMGFDTDFEVYNMVDYIYYLHDKTVYNLLVPYYKEYSSDLHMQVLRIRQINNKPDPVRLNNLQALFRSGSSSKQKKIDLQRGFNPIQSTWESQEHNTETYQAKYTKLGFDMLKEIIEECKKHKISVILVCAPMYKDYKKIVTNYDEFRQKIQNIAIDKHVPYWVYDDTYLSDSSVYFYNIEHMNYIGASLYSKMLSEDIQKYLKNPSYIPNMDHRKTTLGLN